MTEWEDTIVTIAVTARFGRARECLACGGEHAVSSTGEGMDPELHKECPFELLVGEDGS